MKKGIGILLALIMMCSLCACAKPEEQAKEAVVNMIESLKSGEYEKAATFADIDATAALGEDEESKKMIGLMFSGISYNIVSTTKVDDSTVMVKMEITNKDMGAVMEVYLGKMFEIALGVGEEMTAEEASAKSQSIMTECISDPAIGTHTELVDVKVVKVENGWQVQSDEAFTNALLGGLVSAVKSYQ